jgi:hypothetical protein
MKSRFLASLLTMALVACGHRSDPEPLPDVGSVDLGQPDRWQPDTSREACVGEVTLSGEGQQSIDGEGDCEVTLTLPEAVLVEITATGPAELTADESTEIDEPGWLAPRRLEAGEHPLNVRAEEKWSVTVQTYGAPVDEIDRDRSLVWTDPELLDDPDVVGLEKLMTLAADGDDGGELFAYWLRRFATTAHSERVGPLQFLEEIEDTRGDDPSQWDLDALEFKVTAVHNRVDLATANSCGELRVSVASTHQVYQPFHAIFLFEQLPGEGDLSPGGTAHCGATLRRWARLSQLDDEQFRAAALEILDEGLQPERFLMVETVEFIISPWEWRQWVPRPNPDVDSALDRVLENPPLFQTAATDRLNAAGATRDAFLEFVEENAAELDARRMLLPERFRSQSARVNAGVPWVPIDLDDVDPAVTEEFPELRQNIEIVGCPACHATDADFIQTRPDRTFSPFYDKELDARADYLRDAHQGAVEPPPFGPLQDSPLLPP